jgi:adenylosuccinate synthase
VVRDFPPDRRALEVAEPMVKKLKGWKRPTVGLLDAKELPQEAQDYVDFIEQEIEAPVSLLSTGPRREETIVRRHPVLERLTSGKLGKVIAER